MASRHLLTLTDLSTSELRQLIDRGIELKELHRAGKDPQCMKGKVLGMIFEKSSTRTRVSFEAGMAHLGGQSIFLSPRDTQLGRGEPIEDSARVLSRMVDVVMIRTFAHEIVERFARHSRVPVINGLTDEFHPCQLLADLQTFVEHRGDPQGKVVTWVGDGNNMCHSYINAARLWDFELRIACPPGFEPDAALVDANRDRVTVFRDPREAIRGAHWVSTDVWASMGQEEEQQARLQKFSGFQVNHELMALAHADAIFMHCLPAHRGEEVSAELLEDTGASVVWDEAENRLHAQKALLEFLMAQ
ncbi:ornithine carbamoyltransferase [Gilvimarinus sp. F26214L]|uniref:ornithine carbamoyltransferase n=1 Tax=Gilvimarinus sp. DZF01 TaxID=3461371 RepID=UPI0040461287